MPATEGAKVECVPETRVWSEMRVHMIGIGGCGMSGAAVLLRRLGATVSGSDRATFDGLASLVREGIRVSIGHRETQLDPGTTLVVASAAIPTENPEFVAARQAGIPIVKYAHLLGLLMKDRKGVAIAGTHGKSTTTAMSAFLFRAAGLQPSFVVGARCDQLGGHSDLGAGPYLIAESCEFDRSFLHLTPHSAVILNIEADHLDCYRDVDEIVEAFARFSERVHPAGLLVCNGDDPRALVAAHRAQAQVATFGFSPGVDWRAVKLRGNLGRVSFKVVHKGNTVLATRLSIPGKYNVANALAALILAHHAGADLETLGQALPLFMGVHRRLTWRGEGSGIVIVDDYAHHPTEIRVTIEAARSRYRPKRTWVVFQPHQYSRTRSLMNEFAESFDQADEIIVPQVYGARETDLGCPDRAAEELVDRICRNGRRASFLATLNSVTEHVHRHAREGDLVLTMGAGDVWKVADELVECFCRSDSMPRPARAADLVPAGGLCPVSVSAA